MGVIRLNVRGLAVATIIGIGSVLPVAQAQPPAPRFPVPQGPRVTSPEVAADGRVTFRILAPKAQAVRLLGDIPSEGPTVPMQPPTGRALTKGEEGVWDVTVGPVAPGAYRYKFNVDGVPVLDPRNPATSESNENVWSLVHVPGSDFMDTKPTCRTARSPRSLTTRRRSEPVPADARLHAAGLRDGRRASTRSSTCCTALATATTRGATVGRAGFILDNLIAAGKAKPMIVVMPAGHTGPVQLRRPRRTARPAGATSSTSDFTNDIRPYVEKHYRVLDRPRRTARSPACRWAARRRSTSPSPISTIRLRRRLQLRRLRHRRRRPDADASGPELRGAKRQDASTTPALKKGLKLVWFATGKDDFLIETTRATVDMLKKHGFDVVYKETAGGHTWINWREYLSEFAPMLFR